MRAVRNAFVAQAEQCERLGSPFTARLLRLLGVALDRETPLGQAVLDWPGQPDAAGDALPLRLAASLNSLARDGEHPALMSAWPSGAGVDDRSFRELIDETMRTESTALLPWLGRVPQTNEVGRSAAVYAALMHVAARTSKPMALFELGASAGLNLNCDSYGYCLGDRRCGARDSDLVLTPVWTGHAPDGVEPIVMSRRGCDLAPVDASDPVEQERLLCYVWPDQTLRLERLAQALRVAQKHPVVVDAADAADWIETHLPIDNVHGTARVLFHTIARQYFSADVEARVQARLMACAASATAETPFAHVSFEQDSTRGSALDVTMWSGRPDDGMTVRLAHGQAHGASFDWYGSRSFDAIV